LTFYRLPRQHHKNLKSTNLLERLNEEVRALAVEMHENSIEATRYLNMQELKEPAATCKMPVSQHLLLGCPAAPTRSLPSIEYGTYGRIGQDGAIFYATAAKQDSLLLRVCLDRCGLRGRFLRPSSVFQTITLSAADILFVVE
jgi:hypothetical protein